MTTITARRKTLPLTLCTLLASGGALLATETQASATFKIDDTKWVSLGAGLRTSFSSIEDDTASGDNSKDFMLDSIRLYVNGQIHQYIKFTFNTERQETGDGSEDIRTLDAIARFEFNDYANIWAGRLLPPSDRSNLDGPYYLSTWDFPLVQAYPAIYAGRDDGVAFWGQTGGGKFKYQIGAFQGCADGAPCDIGANDSDPVYTYDPTQCESEFKASTLTSPDGKSLWDTGFRMTIAYNTGNTARQTVAQIFQQELSAVNENFVIEVTGLPWPTFLKNQRASTLPIFVSGWLEDIHDPHNWVVPYTVGTYGARQKMPADLVSQFNEIINRGVAESDPAKRATIYAEFNKLFYDNIPTILLYVPTGRHYEQRWVQGYYRNPVYSGVAYWYALSKQ